ncbi:TPA: winged helix-turn-helix transcriptional regulator [Thermoplasmata archaeon]|nr:winged helix-turn-helix transcriptional regulator [Thermoplasmata archaeon]
MRVELDKKSIFALASDTRLEILKSLQPMRRTVSQLSEELNIDKGAVHRHLKKMEEGGLVKRHEDHGFVYYGLTWKARDLVAPNENTRIVIVLSSIWMLSMVAILFIAAGLMSAGGNDTLIALVPDFGGSEDGSSTSAMDSHDSDIWVMPAVLVVAVIAALVALLVVLVPKPFQKFPEDSEGVEVRGGDDGDD